MTTAAPTDGYSLENAARFGWSSVSGDLLPERVELLDRYVVGRTVLDAGCGGGAFVDYLARKGFDATGVDKHAVFLGVAEERGFKGRFLQADLTDRLPFPDRSFDTTICFDVLEHVADDSAAVRELARVTRRRLLVTVPQEDRWMPGYRLAFSTYRDPTHLRYYTPDSLRALAELVGPARVEVFGEQRVLVGNLARQWLKPQSRYPLLTRVYERLLTFLVLRSPPPELYMNLAAVIDLGPDTPHPDPLPGGARANERGP
jgi:SAM-dependent methyltransferase